MEPVKQPESTETAAAIALQSEKKQYTPLNLKPYYIYARFPILMFMGTLGVGAFIASMLYDLLVK